MATLAHISGWTILSFWDRSVDRRNGCNSAFVIPAEVNYITAISVAQERFAWVWDRFPFDVVPYEETPNAQD